VYASLLGISGALRLDAFDQPAVKNPVLPHGASSKEKALLAIHPRSSERGILAFSRKGSFPVAP
jgi:hypothetical protein